MEFKKTDKNQWSSSLHGCNLEIRYHAERLSKKPTKFDYSTFCLRVYHPSLKIVQTLHVLTSEHYGETLKNLPEDINNKFLEHLKEYHSYNDFEKLFKEWY